MVKWNPKMLLKTSIEKWNDLVGISLGNEIGKMSLNRHWNYTETFPSSDNFFLPDFHDIFTVKSLVVHLHDTPMYSGELKVLQYLHNVR